MIKRPGGRCNDERGVKQITRWKSDYFFTQKCHPDNPPSCECYVSELRGHPYYADFSPNPRSCEVFWSQLRGSPALEAINSTLGHSSRHPILLLSLFLFLWFHTILSSLPTLIDSHLKEELIFFFISLVSFKLFMAMGN